MRREAAPRDSKYHKNDALFFVNGYAFRAMRGTSRAVSNRRGFGSIPNPRFPIRWVIYGTVGSGFDSDSDSDFRPGSSADSGSDFYSGDSWMVPPKFGCGSPQG